MSQHPSENSNISRHSKNNKTQKNQPNTLVTKNEKKVHIAGPYGVPLDIMYFFSHLAKINKKDIADQNIFIGVKIEYKNIIVYKR